MQFETLVHEAEYASAASTRTILQSVERFWTCGIEASPRTAWLGGLDPKWPIPDKQWGPQPKTLVIARHSRILHKIKGDPFIWAWMFQANGTRVAFESGPMHFLAELPAFDLRTGKEVAHYDYFRDVPEDAPEWIKLLEPGKGAFHD